MLHALAARAHHAGDAEHAVVAGLRMDAERHADRLGAVVDRVEHAVAHVVEAINVGRQHRRDCTGFLKIFQFFDSSRRILTGNQADGEKPLGIGGAIFDQPLIHRPAQHGGQFFVHQAVDGERDLRAEKNRNVDAFFVHVLEPGRWIDHAVAKAARLIGHRSGNAGTKPLRRRPETAFQQNARVAFVVFQPHRRLRAPLLRHSTGEIDVAFVDMAVGVDDQNIVEVVHGFSSAFVYAFANIKR